MSKKPTRPGVAAAALVVVPCLAAAVALVASHANVLLDGFIAEDLDSMREFLRHPSLGGLQAGLLEMWAIIGPGGRLHPGWFLEHKGHLVIEGLLIVIIAVMLLQSRFSPKATEEDDGLTEKVGACCQHAEYRLVPLPCCHLSVAHSRTQLEQEKS